MNLKSVFMLSMISALVMVSIPSQAMDMTADVSVGDVLGNVTNISRVKGNLQVEILKLKRKNKWSASYVVVLKDRHGKVIHQFNVVDGKVEVSKKNG